MKDPVRTSGSSCFLLFFFSFFLLSLPFFCAFLCWKKDIHLSASGEKVEQVGYSLLDLGTRMVEEIDEGSSENPTFFDGVPIWGGGSGKIRNDCEGYDLGFVISG